MTYKKLASIIIEPIGINIEYSGFIPISFISINMAKYIIDVVNVDIVNKIVNTYGAENIYDIE